MIRALYTSGNAMMTQQTGIDSISNNIANINTVGYKGTRTTFSSILSQTIDSGTSTTDPMQVGLGAKLSSTDTVLAQGELLSTDKTTDVALEGGGFFTLLNPDSMNSYYFTRAGNFSFDADKNFVTPDGYKVAGWMAQPATSGEGFYLPTDPATGIPTVPLEPINITNYENVPAVSSTYIRFKANLNAGDTLKEYLPADADKNFNILFDANGESLNVQDGDNFQISYDNGNSWHTYEYDSNGAASVSAESFSTLDDLINSINTDMSAINGNAVIDNGSIKITNNDPANDITIRVRPTYEDSSFATPQENQKLTTIISNLNQIIKPSESAKTQQMNVAAHTVHSFFYDSSGQKHNIDTTFRKTATNQWEYEIGLPDNEGTITNNTGTIGFDGNGGLSAATVSPTVNLSLNNGYGPTQLKINLWNTDSGAYEGNQYSGMTQFALDSDTSFQTQDGSPSGEFEKVNIDYQGNMTASYTNGKSYNIAKLAVSKFANPQGLERIGKTMFRITPNVDTQSVLASNGYIGVANQGGRGSIISSHLEASNVNLANEFTDLIVYQRAFQANSKGVTTADEIIQTAIQLKR